MPIPPPARPGNVVEIRDRTTPFSFWPIGSGKRREKLQSTLFAKDPWFLISREISEIRNLAARVQAGALLKQAEDFYEAAENSQVDAAKPLLVYYSFLNLAKALIAKRANAPIGRIYHGLIEKLPVGAGSFHGEVSIKLADPQEQAFYRFASVLSDAPVAAVAGANARVVRSQDFLAQILIGHRIFCDAENFVERFISVERIEFIEDDNRRMWLAAYFAKEDIRRLGYSSTQICRALSRVGDWRQVQCQNDGNAKELVKFEQIQTVQYAQRPSQELNALSDGAKRLFWRTVTSYPPYRKYYVYVETSAQFIMHQLLSIYLSSYYFGSITRYKPEGWETVLGSGIGPFVNDFFSTQPAQFLYLMASEFSEREIAKAAVT